MTKWLRHQGFRSTALTAAVALMVMGSAGRASAQVTDRPTRMWVDLGLTSRGARDLETDAGLTMRLTMQRDVHQVALRTLFTGDFSGFPSGSDDTISEIGLTYGRWASSSIGYASVSAGVAIVRVKGLPGDDGGGFSASDDASRRTVGVPLVAQIALQSKVIGVGIEVFANLNTLSAYAGVGLSLHLGWMP